jgi:phage tail-like protein
VTKYAVNPHRHDPYKNHRFRVQWDGQIIPCLVRMGPLRRSTEVVKYREGGDPPRVGLAPGVSRYEPITLERGLTHDTSFEEWADQVFDATSGTEDVALAAFRKDVLVEFMNEAGQVALAYRVLRAWPSEYQVFQGLDALDSEVAIERLVLQNEGWIRDPAVAEPVEPD